MFFTNSSKLLALYLCLCFFVATIGAAPLGGSGVGNIVDSVNGAGIRGRVNEGVGGSVDEAVIGEWNLAKRPFGMFGFLGDDFERLLCILKKHHHCGRKHPEPTRLFRPYPGPSHRPHVKPEAQEVSVSRGFDNVLFLLTC